MKNIIVHYKIRKRFKWIYKVVYYSGSMVSLDTIQVKIMNDHGIKNPKRLVVHSTNTMTESDAKKYVSSLGSDGIIS